MNLKRAQWLWATSVVVSCWFGSGRPADAQLPGAQMLPSRTSSVAVNNGYVYVVRGNQLYKYHERDLSLVKQVTIPAAKRARSTQYTGIRPRFKRQRFARVSGGNVRIRGGVRTYGLRSIPLPP